MSDLILVTPPDYQHGEVMKSLLINPTSDEKDQVQNWLKDNDDLDLILYIYNNDDDIPWLTNAICIVDNVYFNLDNTTDSSYNYASYLISKSKVTYKSYVKDYSLINRNRIYNIDEYIQRNWLD